MAFRQIQAETDAIISGSSALELLGGYDFGTKNDLDVYVNQNCAGEVFAFMRAERYSCGLWSDALGEMVWKPTLYGGTTMKVATWTRGAEKVDIVVVPHHPLSSILKFHSSTCAHDDKHELILHQRSL